MSKWTIKGPSFLNSYCESLRYAAIAGLFLFAMPGTAYASTLYDNLSYATSDTVVASGDTWLAQALTTDASSYVLRTVTLLLAADDTPIVNIYSDNSGEPDSLVGSLSLSSDYSSTIGNVSFSSSGIALNANTTYWVVLTDSVSASWAWTTSNSGNGTAFSTASAESDDAGSTWFIADSYPYQMNVSDEVTAVPLPASLPLMLSAVTGIVTIGRRKTHK